MYANYRFDQIKKVHAKHLAAAAPPGKPFNLLLVGSDSRAFVSNATQINAFGNQGNAGGQRSDVTMVARFDPAAKTVTVLSIPRDLWVDIPGNESGISGMNRINAAYDSGPDLLIQTIEQVLGIPINHYMSVDFPGFSGMVNALGGITMDFPTAVKDAVHGPRRDHDGLPGGERDGGAAAGAQPAPVLHELERLLGVRRPVGLQPHPATGRLLPGGAGQAEPSSLDPFTINSFIGAAVGNLTIDDTLSKGDLLNIAQDFRSLPSSHLITETLPDHRVRHRRRRGRAEGGAALRPEHHRRLQPNRDHSGPDDLASAGERDRHPTTVPTETHSQVDVTS